MDILPNEVLLTIFSYCPYDDLVTNVPYVCQRWREMVETKSLWKGIVCRPHNWFEAYDLTSRLECSPLLRAVDLSALNLLGKYSWEKSCNDFRKIHNPVQGLKNSPAFQEKEILRQLALYCPNIQYLQINFYEPEDYGHFKFLIDKYVGIKVAPVDHELLGYGLRTIGRKFLQLKTLIINGQYPLRAFLPLVPVPFQCLQHIECEWADVNRIDVEKLVSHMKDQLLSIRLPCGTEDGHCTLSLLQPCKKLTSLSLDKTCDFTKRVTGLQHITTLCIRGGNFSSHDCCVKFFTSFYGIVDLSLCKCKAYSDDIIDVVASRCPSLRKLLLEEGFVNNGTFSRLYKIRNLRSLSFRNWNTISSCGVPYLRNISELENINFFRCYRLTDKIFEILPSFPKLRRLVFVKCYCLYQEDYTRLRNRIPRVHITFEGMT